MLIVGYRGNFFIIKNSWGTDWGADGYCYMPKNVLAASDPTLVAVVPRGRAPGRAGASGSRVGAGAGQRAGRGAPPSKPAFRVRAPWGQAMYPGVVERTYGKLVFVRFDDGDEAWVPMVATQPPGTPMAPPSEPCAVRVGQRVDAPWARAGRFGAIVDEVHGRMAHVRFDDGSAAWVPGSDCRPIGGAPQAASAPAGPPGPAATALARVHAPGPHARGSLLPASVLELHGRLARVRFDDGVEAWVEMSATVPPGTPVALPRVHNPCWPGQRVLAPWGPRGDRYPAAVLECHGALVHVRFDDGSAWWVAASACV